jgi:hypothetical protein
MLPNKFGRCGAWRGDYLAEIMYPGGLVALGFDKFPHELSVDMDMRLCALINADTGKPHFYINKLTWTC